MKNDREENIFDPYATDDPNVGDVQYGEMRTGDERSGADRRSSARPSVGSRNSDRPNDGPGDSPGVGQNARPGGNGSHGRHSIDELDSASRQAISKKQLHRRVQGKTRRAGIKLNVGLLLTVLVFVLVVAGCVLHLTMRVDDHDIPPAVQTTDVPPTGQMSAPKPVDPALFDSVDVPSADMREGDLILVNYAYEYKFPTDSDVVSVYDFKTRSYKVRDTATTLSKAVIQRFNTVMDDFSAATGCVDMLVNSGFRDYDFQNEIYTERVQTEGAEQAAKYVALPGYSEHHTGLAMDLSVYLANGTSVAVADYELCDWFEEHAPEYGFVLRYPPEKAAITRISYEAWHYRYVGVPHAEIMYERNMCLEEYVDFLRQYRCTERYLSFTQGASGESVDFPKDADYVIYFVPASQESTTAVPVPKGMEYEISGNNVDGFVVTAHK